jgi:hypothetical protein
MLQLWRYFSELMGTSKRPDPEMLPIRPRCSKCTVRMIPTGIPKGLRASNTACSNARNAVRPKSMWLPPIPSKPTRWDGCRASLDVDIKGRQVCNAPTAVIKPSPSKNVYVAHSRGSGTITQILKDGRLVQKSPKSDLEANALEELEKARHYRMVPSVPRL